MEPIDQLNNELRNRSFDESLSLSDRLVATIWRIQLIAETSQAAHDYGITRKILISGQEFLNKYKDEPELSFFFKED